MAKLISLLLISSNIWWCDSITNDFSKIQSGLVGRSDVKQGNGKLPPAPPPSYLWCLFCRSDRDPACINKAQKNIDKWSDECTYERMKEFDMDLNISKPARPVTIPRSDNLEFACYRQYTLDGTFALRTCVIAIEPVGTGDESCHPCEFGGAPAKCCTCFTSDCNSKNSDATRIFKEPIAILRNALLSILLSLAVSLTS